LFNLGLFGQGIVALESPVARNELIEVELEDDELRIDGSFAVAWSSSLKFTVERTTKSLIGSAASGEGLVNVYRGSGKVLMAPVDI
ncbi:MAG: AIM24 family protein, partial [Anaerococcus sp.]|nr:AIM24 family protein [Anaerococcus sp.]